MLYSKDQTLCRFAFGFPEYSRRAEHMAGSTHLITYIAELACDFLNLTYFSLSMRHIVAPEGTNHQRAMMSTLISIC